MKNHQDGIPGEENTQAKSRKDKKNSSPLLSESTSQIELFCPGIVPLRVYEEFASKSEFNVLVHQKKMNLKNAKAWMSPTMVYLSFSKSFFVSYSGNNINEVNGLLLLTEKLSQLAINIQYFFKTLDTDSQKRKKRLAFSIHVNMPAQNITLKFLFSNETNMGSIIKRIISLLSFCNIENLDAIENRLSNITKQESLLSEQFLRFNESLNLWEEFYPVGG